MLEQHNGCRKWHSQIRHLHTKRKVICLLQLAALCRRVVPDLLPPRRLRPCEHGQRELRALRHRHQGIHLLLPLLSRDAAHHRLRWQVQEIHKSSYINGFKSPRWRDYLFLTLSGLGPALFYELDLDWAVLHFHCIVHSYYTSKFLWQVWWFLCLQMGCMTLRLTWAGQKYTINATIYPNLSRQSVSLIHTYILVVESPRIRAWPLGRKS